MCPFPCAHTRICMFRLSIKSRNKIEKYSLAASSYFIEGHYKFHQQNISVSC